MAAIHAVVVSGKTLYLPYNQSHLIMLIQLPIKDQDIHMPHTTNMLNHYMPQGQCTNHMLQDQCMSHMAILNMVMDTTHIQSEVSSEIFSNGE